MPMITTPYGKQVFVPWDAPTLTPPPSAIGTWLLMHVTERTQDWMGRAVTRTGLRYVRQPVAMLPLHPLEEHDPRIAELASGRKVSTCAPTFQLCDARVVADRYLVGVVAVSLAGGSVLKEGTPNLWVDGEPFGFLLRTRDSVYQWIQRAAASPPRPSWFTTDGASLWRLAVATRAPSQYLEFAFERVA